MAHAMARCSSPDYSRRFCSRLTSTKDTPYCRRSRATRLAKAENLTTPIRRAAVAAADGQDGHLERLCGRRAARRHQARQRSRGVRYPPRWRRLGAALDQNIREHGLKSFGRWSTPDMPRRVCAAKENRSGRAEASKVRAKFRGEAE
jgi:hypothetical protein